MSGSIRSMPLPSSALFGFLGVTAIAAASAIANRVGAIGPEVMNRLIGVALGLMIILVGNSLPKMRPFNRARLSGRAAAVERFSGWMLVLAGITWAALFSFAPLRQAKWLAGTIGIGSMAVIIVSWIGLAGQAFLAGKREDEAMPIRSERAERKSILTKTLLLAFFYVFVIACTRFLFAGDLSIWIWTTFWLMYAVAYAFGNRGRRTPQP
jgi:hypothetical protein